MLCKIDTRRVLLTISYILLALWLAFIFYNSSLCADDSSASSGVFVKLFVERIMGIDFDSADESTLTYVTKIIRKIAHFTEYAILCALDFFILTLHRKKTYFCAIAPIGFCAVVAVLDEYSQNFASGRSPQISDVLIDVSGGLFASLSLFLLTLLISKIRKNVRKNEHI